MASRQSFLFDFENEPVITQELSGAEQKNAEAVSQKNNTSDPVKTNHGPQETEIKKSTRGRKKISEAAISADLIKVPEDEILFQKKYYSIGLVAEMFKVNISLIRFWENEFDILKPKKNGKGDRHFRPEDIKNLKMIHHLLREKKYTIEGARDFIKNHKNAEENFSVIEQLRKTKAFLNELKLSL